MINRKIKFRAYLKNEKKMIDVKSIDWDENGNLISINYPEGKDYFGYKEDDIVLMQYTGVRDKNGEEIYEGDIVEWLRAKFEIKWLLSSFCICNRKIGNLALEIGVNQCGIQNRLIVIGNIYENPELLEKIGGWNI